MWMVALVFDSKLSFRDQEMMWLVGSHWVDILRLEMGVVGVLADRAEEVVASNVVVEDVGLVVPVHFALDHHLP